MQEHGASFIAHTEASVGVTLFGIAKEESDAVLECGTLSLRSGDWGHQQLLAFSCMRRGFCPSCGTRLMSRTVAHSVDRASSHVPVRRLVLSLPIPLSLLLASQLELVMAVLQVVQHVLMRHLLLQAGLVPVGRALPVAARV